eukprot:2441126-Rhodomonas_salina.1
MPPPVGVGAPLNCVQQLLRHALHNPQLLCHLPRRPDLIVCDLGLCLLSSLLSSLLCVRLLIARSRVARHGCGTCDEEREQWLGCARDSAAAGNRAVVE